MKLRDAPLPTLPTGSGSSGPRAYARSDQIRSEGPCGEWRSCVATSSEPSQARPRKSPHRFSRKREVRFRSFSSAVSVLRLGGGIQPAGVPVVYVPRSRLVCGPAGHPGCYPGLRRGHVLLHGRSCPSSVDPSGKLRRRCLGDLCGELCGGPDGSLPSQSRPEAPLSATEADHIPPQGLRDF